MSLVPFASTRKPAYSNSFEDFDRVFDQFFNNALGHIAVPAGGLGVLSLRLNVAETDKSYHIEAELPGVDDKDIEVNVKDGILSLSGEKRHEEESKDKTFHRIERSYGSFQRSLQLPSDADENSIEAHMKNGVLQIDIAKIKEAVKEPKKIFIRKK